VQGVPQLGGFDETLNFLVHRMSGLPWSTRPTVEGRAGQAVETSR
jgi:hypothetical protein